MVILTQDVLLTSSISIPANVSMSLNGKTMTFVPSLNDEAAIFMANGSVLKNGEICKDLLYKETVHEDGSIISLAETNFYRKQKRIALRNCGVIDPENIDEYLAFDGYKALEKALTTMTREQVIEEVLVPLIMRMIKC